MPSFKVIGRIRQRRIQGHWVRFEPPLNAVWYGDAKDSPTAYLKAAMDLFPANEHRGEILEVTELTDRITL